MNRVFNTQPKIGDCIFDHVKIKKDIKKLKSHYDRAMAGEGHISIEEYGEGEKRYFYEIRYSPIFDEKKEIVGITSFAQNITDRKKAEEEMKNLAKFPEENTNPVMRISRDGTLLYINPSGKWVTDTDGVEVGGKVLKKWHKVLKNIHESGKQIEEEVTIGDKVLSCILIPVPDTDYINGYAVDITHRKELEEQLLAIINKSPIPTAVGNSLGSIDYFNKALEKLTGYKKREINDVMEWAVKLYPDPKYRKYVQGNIEQSLKGKKQDTTEFTITCKDSSEKIIEFYTSFFKDGLVIQMVDITERKKTEESLRDSEEWFRAIVDHSYDLMTIYDTATNKLVWANENWTKFFGYCFAEIPDPTAPVHPDDLDLVMLKLKELDSGVIEEIRNMEYRCKSAFDSQYRIVEVNIVRLNLAGRNVLFTGARDITESKKAEEVILKQQEELKSKNAALKEILEQITVEKDSIKKEISANIEKLIKPQIVNLKKNLKKKNIEQLEESLNNMSDSFGLKISSQEKKLTPREIQICDLIRKGCKNKEISSMLKISVGTVEINRKNIRKKLGISGENINLQSYLQDL